MIKTYTLPADETAIHRVEAITLEAEGAQDELTLYRLQKVLEGEFGLETLESFLEQIVSMDL